MLETWRTFPANRNAQTYAIAGSNHIDESAYVKIGGIDQWITIRGASKSLRALHGGDRKGFDISLHFFADLMKVMAIVHASGGAGDPNPAEVAVAGASKRGFAT